MDIYVYVTKFKLNSCVFHGFSLSLGSLTFTAKTNIGRRKFTGEGMVLKFEIHTFGTISFHSVKSEFKYMYPSRS